jgi:hypothetical protein
VQLAFFLAANKHPTSYEDVFIRYQRLQNLVWMFYQKLFVLTSKPPFTTQWQERGQAWKVKHVVSIWDRAGGGKSLGLSKQYGKKGSEVSQFLKKIFWLSLLPPAEGCYCFALEFLSNLPNDKRVEQFCDYLLETYDDEEPIFPRPVSSTNVLHHHWGPQTQVSYSMPTSMHYAMRFLIFLFWYLHCKKCRMRRDTTRRFKKSATFKKEDLIS